MSFRINIETAQKTEEDVDKPADEEEKNEEGMDREKSDLTERTESARSNFSEQPSEKGKHCS